MQRTIRALLASAILVVSLPLAATSADKDDEMVDIPLDHLLEIAYADLHKNQADFKRIAHELDPTKTPDQVLAENGNKSWQSRRVVNLPAAHDAEVHMMRCRTSGRPACLERGQGLHGVDRVDMVGVLRMSTCSRALVLKLISRSGLFSASV